MVELSDLSLSTLQQGTQVQYQTSSLPTSASTQSIDVDMISSSSNAPQQQIQKEIEPVVNAQDISLLLIKLFQQQQREQKVELTSQNNDNFKANNSVCSSFNQQMDVKNEKDSFHNESKVMSANLSALKHDHPLIASTVDNKSISNVVSARDEMLIASLPPLPSSLSSPIDYIKEEASQWDMMKANMKTSNSKSKSSTVTSLNGLQQELTRTQKSPNCLPYGYYYDESKLQTNDKNISTQLYQGFCDLNEVTSLKNNLNFNDSNDSMMFDDDYIKPYNHANYIDNCIYDTHMDVDKIFQVDKADIKSGPTLAQLNLNMNDDIWDSLDLDEREYLDYLCSTNTNTQLNELVNKKPKIQRTRYSSNNNTRYQNMNGTTGSDSLEYDAKLQENIDYLTSLLFTSNNVSSKATSTSTPSISVSSSITSSTPSTQSKAMIIKQESSSNLPSLNHEPSIEETKNQFQTKTVINQFKSTMNVNVNEPSMKAQSTQQQPQQHLTLPKQQPQHSSSLMNIAMIDAKVNNRIRNNSMSTEYSTSSHDEGFASQPEDSDNDEDNDDMDSDDESFYGDYDAADLLGATTSDDHDNKWALNMGRSRKGGEKRYFWQYNVQSKGPKGTRLTSTEDVHDPHVLKEISDPVFSPDCHVQGVKHSGKARRGDGNDLTPNPRKLLMIGLELKKLSRVINELTPVAEVPMTARSRSRKEKNKLASRACRLKKKAQHEANKIKLFGLQQEHKKTLTAIIEIKRMLKRYLDGSSNSDVTISAAIEHLFKHKGPVMPVAGKSSEFVNTILDNVASGNHSGGLDKI